MPPPASSLRRRTMLVLLGTVALGLATIVALWMARPTYIVCGF